MKVRRHAYNGNTVRQCPECAGNLQLFAVENHQRNETGRSGVE